jgi:hypothetical protein
MVRRGAVKDAAEGVGEADGVGRAWSLKMATREKWREFFAKRAITSPWKGSMKHTRKM